VADKPLHGAPVPHVAFDIYRVPFFLEPDYPKEENFFESNRDRLVRKWGGQANWEEQKRRHALKQRGREAGIERFNLDRLASNTFQSHVLVQWVAKTAGLAASEALYDKLNVAHFVEGRKLNDREMLVQLAGEVDGVDKEEARAYLDSGAGAEDVERMYAKVTSMGIHSIPTFVFDGGRFHLSGAAHTRDIEQVLREIEAEAAEASEAKASPYEARPPLFAGQQDQE